jgi:hypothetical protein
LTNDILNDQQEPVDFGHCLRPVFTEVTLRQLLKKRQSINVIGKRGTGKKRLLEDIRDCNLAGIKVILVDLIDYNADYTKLLQDIHRQLGRTGEVPDRLSDLFEAPVESGVNFLVMIANYDALSNNPEIDDKYVHKGFRNDLGFLKNRENVLLLLTSRKPFQSSPIILENKSYGKSPFRLKTENLSKLSRKEAMNELNRQLDELGVTLPTVGVDFMKMTLIDRAKKSSSPYAFLGFLVSKLALQTEEDKKRPIEKRVKGWRKEFKKLPQYDIFKRLHNFRMFMKKIKTVLGARWLRWSLILGILAALWRWLNKKWGL